jgi:hypothetical protein
MKVFNEETSELMMSREDQLMHRVLRERGVVDPSANAKEST